jgi:hypothetical protein
MALESEGNPGFARSDAHGHYRASMEIDGREIAVDKCTIKAAWP